MGSFQPVPMTEKTTTFIEGDQITVASSEMQGHRISMEDAMIVEPSFNQTMSLFGVFDGHGGREVSKFVQTHFQRQLLANQNFTQGYYEAALIENFNRMDDLLKDPNAQPTLEEIKEENPNPVQSQTFGNQPSSGCTSVVALIIQNRIICANAGDSRCVLQLRNGNVKPLSVDHKPNIASERERVEAAGARVERDHVVITQGNSSLKLNMSRSIGDLDFKQNPQLAPNKQAVISTPDIMSEDKSNVDWMILACDGIWDAMSNQECADFINTRLDSGYKLNWIVEELLDCCLNGGCGNNVKESMDNMSVILVRFN